MATVTTIGTANMLRDLSKLSEDLDVVQDEMLEAGAAVCVEEWKNGIEAAGHVVTGDMRDSVKAKHNAKKKTVTIVPTGKDRADRPNNIKAFKTHYGTKNKPGDRFVDKIEDAAEPKAAAAMQSVLNAHLKKKGLI